MSELDIPDELEELMEMCGVSAEEVRLKFKKFGIDKESQKQSKEIIGSHLANMFRSADALEVEQSTFLTVLEIITVGLSVTGLKDRGLPKMLAQALMIANVKMAVDLEYKDDSDSGTKRRSDAGTDRGVGEN